MDILSKLKVDISVKEVPLAILALKGWWGVGPVWSVFATFEKDGKRYDWGAYYDPIKIKLQIIVENLVEVLGRYDKN